MWQIIRKLLRIKAIRSWRTRKCANILSFTTKTQRFIGEADRLVRWFRNRPPSIFHLKPESLAPYLIDWSPIKPWLDASASINGDLTSYRECFTHNLKFLLAPIWKHQTKSHRLCTETRYKAKTQHFVGINESFTILDHHLVSKANRT